MAAEVRCDEKDEALMGAIEESKEMEVATDRIPSSKVFPKQKTKLTVITSFDDDDKIPVVSPWPSLETRDDDSGGGSSDASRSSSNDDDDAGGCCEDTNEEKNGMSGYVLSSRLHKEKKLVVLFLSKRLSLFFVVVVVR